MHKFARNLGLAILALVAVSILGLVFHYWVRLTRLEHTAVFIYPGKGVWVECQTHGFPATIEEVTASGILVSVGVPLPSGLPCAATEVVARGERSYFMPFRTVLGVKVDGQEVWSNPFSI